MLNAMKGNLKKYAEGIGRGRELTLGSKGGKNSGQMSKRTKSWPAESKLEGSEVKKK